jgi:hypothetical protein
VTLVPNSLAFTVGSYSGSRVGPAMLSDQIIVFNNNQSIDLYEPEWGVTLNGADVGGLPPHYSSCIWPISRRPHSVAMRYH